MTKRSVAEPEDGFIVPIPEHLIASIFEAVENQLRVASDGPWGERKRSDVIGAARLWDALMSKSLTPQQIAEVALLAAQWIEPLWPKTVEDVGNVEKLLAEARELIELHDCAATVASGQREG